MDGQGNRSIFVPKDATIRGNLAGSCCDRPHPNLVEIVRWVIASFGPRKAGLDPPLCGLYRHLLISSLINRRFNDVACGLNDLRR